MERDGRPPPASPAARPFALREEKRARLGNDLGRVPAFVEYLFAGLESLPGDESLLRLGVQEVLINAVEHGNLGIGGREKQRLLEEGGYIAELKRRALEAEQAGRTVEVTLVNSADGLEVTVADMGAGFAAPPPAGKFGSDGLGECGLGMAIARTVFDSIEVAPPGNRVRLFRRARERRPGSWASARALEMEMELAARFQRSLLPPTEELQQLSELQVACCFEPLRPVSGDFFDVRRLEGGAVGIFIADIAGHGVAAALLSSMLKVFFSLHVRERRSPRQLFAALNEELFTVLAGGEFLTAFYGIYSAADRRFVYASANHPPPLRLRRDGGIEKLETDGFFVGVFREARFAEAECRLEPGERLLFYTDGATEAIGDAGARGGVHRLCAALSGSAAQTTGDALAAIRAAVQEEGGPLADDLTLLLVEAN